MVNRNLLIGKVSPFLGKKEIVVANQDTVDIIDALIKNHYKYSNEYDKIFRYFDGGNVEETAFNVWSFLKEEFKYNIEPEEMQILRSPAALLASNIVGIDCKGYATFANGVMDAYRRNTGKNFEVYYRFASYDAFDNTPQHVFAVVEEKGIEYWIDPVLDQFDEKKQPYFYKDKKIKKMALVAMSGIQDNSNHNDTMGDIIQDYNGNFIDTETGEYVGAQTYDSYTKPDNTYTGGSWFQNFFGSSASEIIKAVSPITQKEKVYNAGGGLYYSPDRGTFPADNQPIQPQPKSTGINTNTILLIGAAGLAAYFLLAKKGRK
jgi:hypothetical protein